MTSAIILFMKYPETGKVKTRLGEAIGMQEARDWYEANLLRTMHEADLTAFPVYAAVEGGTDEQWAALLPKASIIRQRGETLGDRMCNAFADLFADFFDSVILTGTDIPHLYAEHFHAARERLRTKDMVLGPAKDGGYYLIALRRDAPRELLFQDIPWSSAQVLETTLLRALAGDITCELIDTLHDVDTVEDLYDI